MQGIIELGDTRPDNTTQDRTDYLFLAHQCWSSLVSNSFTDRLDDSNNPSPSQLFSLFSEEFPDHPIPTPEIAVAFHVAATALSTGQIADARLILNKFNLNDVEDASWPNRVALDTGRALALLVRKSGGWDDVLAATRIIQRLRDLQPQVEEQYLNTLNDDTSRITAIRLVALYYTAQMITIAGTYILKGQSSKDKASNQLDRNGERAVAAAIASESGFLRHYCALVWNACNGLLKNSIWTHVANLGTAANEFARHIASENRDNPVIELWPSQQAALARNLLDPYKRAILVEMPTSAGKTLLAKFSIVQAQALNPDSSIAYVVPTRALVNQITLDLRSDFRELGWQIEQAIPSYELNPTEESLLRSKPDILVTTPEKLDLLIKSSHPAVESLSLVVADEAHNLADTSTRGPRLELLLATIKRERTNTRFLLLSPFLPNGEELAEWLGDDRSLSIKVDWQPGRKIIGYLSTHGRKENRGLYLTTVNSSHSELIPSDINVMISRDVSANSVGKLTNEASKELLNEGSVLVLCRGRGTAATRATELSIDRNDLTSDEFTNAVCQFAIAEAGFETSLVKCIRRGVAYHHSGLSHELRWLIERLIASGRVKVVCGTTTLAQGMNFPIRTVIVETLKKGDIDLTFNDFWNIAGRAGRALLDSVGIIGYCAPNKSKREGFQEFIRSEAENVSSQLAKLLVEVESIGTEFNLRTVEKWPQMAELMKFLAHAMRAAGHPLDADEIDDVLRSSLIYRQAERQGPQATIALQLICNRYLQKIRTTNVGVLKLADQTGFATPSVLALLGRSKDTDISDPRTWDPLILFGEDKEHLTERVQMISEMPEMSLGDGTGGPFDAARVASILRDWVSGTPLGVLAQTYCRVDGDRDSNLSQFGNYLFSNLVAQASWGLGALEGIALAGKDLTSPDLAFVPSMVFYGVRSKEAVWLRMAGVPRISANGLASQWRENHDEPKSYNEIREWVSSLSDEQWMKAVPEESTLNAEHMRILWNEFR